MRLGSVPSLLSATTAPRLRKGELTRAAILEAALAQARRAGLEAVTIGQLADELQMSKSGVFAHFGSREELQLAVLGEYAIRFVNDVLKPAVQKPAGLPRLHALLENWLCLLARELEQGCLMISGASEYDDRPGSLRDAMVGIVSGWNLELRYAIDAARDAGHLHRATDGTQLVFEIYGLMLALHQDARLLRSKDSMQRARQALARLLDGATTERGWSVLKQTQQLADASEVFSHRPHKAGKRKEPLTKPMRAKVRKNAPRTRPA